MDKEIADIGSFRQNKSKNVIRESWVKHKNSNFDQDLLELQEQFLNSNLKPSVTDIKKNKREDIIAVDLDKKAQDSSFIPNNLISDTTSKTPKDEPSNHTKSELQNSEIQYHSNEDFVDPIDSILSDSKPAAQLIKNTAPPIISSKKLNYNSLSQKNTNPLINGKSNKSTFSPSNIENIVKSENILNENYQTNSEKTKSHFIHGLSSEKVPEAFVVSSNNTPLSTPKNTSRPKKPVEKMSLFAQKRLLEKTDPTIISTLKKNSNITNSKGIKNFLTTKVVENDVKRSFISDHKPSLDGFPKMYHNDYKTNESSDINNSNSNIDSSPLDQPQESIKTSQKKKVSFYDSPKEFEPQSNKEMDEADLKISQMSQHDIMDAKEEIQHLLSPKSIDFLMKRNSSKKFLKSKARPILNDLPTSKESILSLVNEKLRQEGKAIIEDVEDDKEKGENIVKSDDFYDSNHPAKVKGSSKSKGLESKKVENKDTINLDVNDSDFYKKLKDVYFENEVSETDKMEWITSFSQAKSPSERVLENLKEQSNRVAKITRDLIDGKPSSLIDDPTSHLRFDFNGSLVDVLDDIPTYKGLHHHGENPDDAGYTIPELLHLSRSTVPGQRSIAIKLIGQILHNINTMTFSDTDSYAIYMCWLDWEGYLYFIPTWMDSYLTVQVESIKSSWTWVVGMDTFNQLPVNSNSALGNGNSAFSSQTEAVSKTFQALGLFLDELIANSHILVPELLSDRIPLSSKKMVCEIVHSLYKYNDEFASKLDSQKSILSTVSEIKNKRLL
ncbi:RNA polymerase II-associated protein rba50 [Smittium mucronatum]|uniref:RNA polymerase II-associated protein rba50 n=1 Tax=Smittium mucronatum TaxID=133383 RepID=A0A1R0H773_9FUNG|nr:RNA polymerase II-associated protein rba50 [Smittium mucronatum]